MKTKQAVRQSTPTETGNRKTDPKQTTQQIKDLLRVLENATEKAVLFEVEANQDSKVFVAGTFNEWNPTTHPLEYHVEDEIFRATLLLEPGTHEYKFVIDGVWSLDVKCPQWVINDNGIANSVLHVSDTHTQRRHRTT